MLRYPAFIETGSKKIMAGLIDQPGLCRWGKSEDELLENLLVQAPRYHAAMKISHSRLLPRRLRSGRSRSSSDIRGMRPPTLVALRLN